MVVADTALEAAAAAIIVAKEAELRRTSTPPWRSVARPEQLPPDGDWRIWYLHGGRGSGKTRAGAETLAEWMLSSPRGEWAIVAPTFSDARDTCVEGPSGLIAALGQHRIARWNRSIGELYLHNGTSVRIDGADDGALRIQGKNLRGAWCDEIALWRDWKRAWDESLAFAVRLDPARIVATGTPKSGHGLVRRLMEDVTVPKSLMRTADNVANLSPTAVEELSQRYEGTRLGRQELGGEYIAEAEGALWTYALLDGSRIPSLDGVTLSRVVVAVDPALTSGDDSDETGIIVAGTGDCSCKGLVELHGFVLADRSCRLSPDGWANRVIVALDEFDADHAVVEINAGGDLVKQTLQTARRNLPVREVRASKGKRVRAEPVAALYEQGKVHHVGTFAQLEDQMTAFVPEGGADHDDRVDALVYALTDLMVGRRQTKVWVV